MPSRIRNKLIFLACLIAFAGFGFLFYRVWVMQRPFAVILFVADNLSPSTVSAARLFAGGADYRFNMESLPQMALASPQARDYAVADSSAAASALATGQTVNRGSLSVTPEGQVLGTLLEYAQQQGRATGLVSNTTLTDATTAAFFAAGTDAKDTDTISRLLIEKAPADVILGGGASQLVPSEQGGTRQDGRDLLLAARQLGFDVVRTKEELDNTPTWRTPKIFGIFADGPLAFAEDRSRQPSQPGLSDLVRRSIELLQFNRRGYFLIVHAGLIEKAAVEARGESLLREIAVLDEAIATARNFAGEKAVIMVAGLANTGGLQLNAFSFAPDSGVAVLGPSAAGIPALTWSTASAKTDASAPAQAVAAQADRPQQVASDSLILLQAPNNPPLLPMTDLPILHQLLQQQL
jgi:alkaline phosphatase